MKQRFNNKSRPAVFLDRDGTINIEKEYLNKIEDWEWIPGAIEAIQLINQMGLLAIVVTNQAGIARGYYSEDAVHKLHIQVDRLLEEKGAHIDAYYYCPHHPNFGEQKICECRKPNPGMLLAAKEDFNIDFSKSFLIGDKLIDVQAAEKVGVTPILVTTGYGKQDRVLLTSKCAVEKTILEAAKRILKYE